MPRKSRRAKTKQRQRLYRPLAADQATQVRSVAARPSTASKPSPRLAAAMLPTLTYPTELIRRDLTRTGMLAAAIVVILVILRLVLH